MNKGLLAGALLITAVLGQSCRKNTVPQESAVVAAPGKMVLAQPVEYMYLSAKGKVQFESDDDKMTSPINLRMRKDSAIWVSVVPALGLEVVRAVFTPDSVKVLDRIHKTYLSTDYSYFQRNYRVKVDFRTLQELLVGNQPYGLGPGVQVVQTEPLFHTQQVQGSMRINSFVDLTNQKLKKIQMADSVAKNSLAVTYADFTGLGNFVFPYSAIILAQQQGQNAKSAVLTINYNKVSISDPALAFPFDVPASYSRMR